MKKRDLYLFIAASAFIGISSSIDASVFNNFLNDVFNLTVTQRTMLEFPRELPGFLVVFVTGLLLFMGDIRVACIANAIAAIGIMGLGFTSGNFSVLLVWMTIYSMGTHLMQPMTNAIGMSLAKEGNMGKVLGQISGFNTAAYLITSIITAAVFHFVKINYKIAFSFGAAAFVLAAVMISRMTRIKSEKASKKLYLRKEYTLFYILNILFGARKQIFITFGPWVLIKIFNQGVSTFALLGFIIAGIGMLFKPFVGHLIDKKGERFIISCEAVLLIVVCLGYALAKTLSKGLLIAEMAIIVTCSCYVLDQLLVAAGMARATYLKKIAVAPEDVSSTLSMGVTIDHFVSMTIPWLGSFVWNKYGYEYVFVGGACIALLNLIAAQRINTENIKANRAAGAEA
ncbi:MAG: MFS transporter [Bacillota bacterium]